MSTDAAFTAQTGTTWAVMAFVGEPPAVVRVRNLQTTTTSGADAWGRRSKRQPLLVTAEIAFREPFGTSAEHDRLDNDTVDYGTLSTRLLAAVERCDNFHREHASDCSLASLAGHLLDDLAGTGRVGPEFRAISPKPLLTSTAHVFSIRLHLHLPKATLTGEGVSADFVIAFAHFPPSDPADVRPGAAGGLAAGRHALHGLRLPVVVGLREHEKTFEQSVLISVEFEHLSPPISIYNEVEQTVIKTMKSRTFETLEALANAVALDVGVCLGGKEDVPPAPVKVVVSKPIAVPLAESPEVEVRLKIPPKPTDDREQTNIGKASTLG